MLWPRWLKRGGTTDDKLYCWSWGLNCLDLVFQARSVTRTFLAPGPKSKFHDPTLSELADKLNELFSDVVSSRKNIDGVLGIMLVEEGLCLCWKKPLPHLSGKSNDEIREFLKNEKIKEIDSLTAEERQKLFDIK